MIRIKDGLFIHYPKTGGFFVKKFCYDHIEDNELITDGLVKYQRDHLPPSKHDLTQYKYVFTTVRHPIAWHESSWKFMMDLFMNKDHLTEPKTEQPLTHIYKYFSKDFNIYIKNLCKYEPGFYQKSYMEYVGNMKNVDFIKTENLTHQLVASLKKCGIHNKEILSKVATFPKHGKRERKIIWRTELKEQIIKQNEGIIEKFYL